MAGFYDEMQEFASEMLGEFKRGVVTLTRTVTTPPDPSTPWIPGTSTPTEYPLDAVVSAVGDKFVDGTTIFATDRMVTCAVLPIEILPGDALSIDGAPVLIVKTMRIPAAGIAVAWKFIVRD